jgi:hypothetical protein
MRKLFKNRGVFRRDKVEAEAATTSKGTVPADDTTLLAHKPDLYSTEGSIGMKVVAEPGDAVVEYVYFYIPSACAAQNCGQGLCIIASVYTTMSKLEAPSRLGCLSMSRITSNIKFADGAP